MNAMTNIAATATKLVLTGPYLHRPQDCAHLRFESAGETPRSFTVIISEGLVKNGETIKRNGLAILDNDNRCVVIDREYSQIDPSRGPSRQQSMALELMKDLGWREFAAYCGSRKTYRKNVSDLRNEIPDCGNRENQIRLGLLDSREIDNRSDFVRQINAEPDLPYSFPRASRSAMISEIMGHEVYRGAHGAESHLAWDVRMNFRWNQSGKLAVPKAEIEPEFDKQWSKQVRSDESIFQRASEASLAPYLSTPFLAFDAENGIAANLEVAGRNAGFVVMSDFGGAQMGFRNATELAGKLAAMDDEHIMMLWVTCRTLSSDLSVASRSFDMASEFHDIRAEMEDFWRTEEEPALNFG